MLVRRTHHLGAPAHQGGGGGWVGGACDRHPIPVKICISSHLYSLDRLLSPSLPPPYLTTTPPRKPDHGPLTKPQRVPHTRNSDLRVGSYKIILYPYKIFLFAFQPKTEYPYEKLISPTSYKGADQMPALPKPNPHHHHLATVGQPEPWGEAIPRFPNLIHDLAIQVAECAELGLTKEEILEGFCLSLDELQADELRYFNKEYQLGKMRGIKNVARDLHSHSKKPGGMQATMAYLRRFSKNFEKALEDDSSTSGEAFTFNFGSINDPKAK